MLRSWGKHGSNYRLLLICNRKIQLERNCGLFTNTNCPYRVILSISNHTKCLYIVREFAHVFCLHKDMDNVQNVVNPLSGRIIHCI